MSEQSTSHPEEPETTGPETTGPETTGPEATGSDSTGSPGGEKWFDETWTRVHPLSPFVRGWLTVIAIPGIIFGYNWQMWADLWQAYQSGDLQQDFQRNPQLFLLGGGGVLLIFILIFGGFVLSWWFTRYKVTDDYVMIKSGIFFRQHRQARIDRVQAVDLRQPLLARLTGLAELKFEVAEGDGTAATLAFLKKPQAEDMRADIMDRASGRTVWEAQQAEQTEQAVSAEQAGSPAPGGAAPGGAAPGTTAGTAPYTGPAPAQSWAEAEGQTPSPAGVAGPPGEGSSAPASPPLFRDVAEREIARVPFGRLLGSVLTGWGTIILGFVLLFAVGGIVVGLIIALANGLSAGQITDEVSDEVLPVLVSSGLGFSVLIPMLVVSGTVYFQQINGGYGFTATMTGAGLRMRYGLLEKTTQTVPPGRVHALQIQQPMLWRPFGWYKVVVVVAGYGAAEARSTLLPVGKVRHVMAVTAEMFPDLQVEEPEAVFTTGLTGRGTELGFTEVPRRGRIFDPVVRRRRGFLATPSAVMFRDGRLSRRLTMVPHERVQSLSLHQGPLQRVRRLATVHIHSPSGPFQARIKNQELDAVGELFDQTSAYAAVARRLRDRTQWMLPEELHEFERMVAQLSREQAGREQESREQEEQDAGSR